MVTGPLPLCVSRGWMYPNQRPLCPGEERSRGGMVLGGQGKFCVSAQRPRTQKRHELQVAVDHMPLPGERDGSVQERHISRAEEANVGSGPEERQIWTGAQPVSAQL